MLLRFDLEEEDLKAKGIRPEVPAAYSTLQGEGPPFGYSRKALES
jgi:hypothetical protein